MSMNVDMLSGLKAAESMLAKQQSRKTAEEVGRVVRDLPQNDPLVGEFNRQMASGDLDGLPKGHPFWKMLEDAKNRFEASQREAQMQTPEPRRRRDSGREAEEKQAEEEAVRQVRRVAGKTINDQIARLVREMEGLYASMNELEPMLESNPYSRVKMKKLRRMLVACKRGVEECKISVTRV